MPMRRTLACGSALILAAGLAASRGDDDGDGREGRLLAGRQSFVDNCLMCHAEELASRQRLTAKQWTTEVEKMVGWGAPVPKDQVPALIEYLSDQYPAGAAPADLTRIDLAEALASLKPDGLSVEGDPARGAALYAANCATCHGPGALGGDLGTNLVEKPVLTRVAEYRAVVRNGRRRMPGFASILKPDQEADVLIFLRSRQFAGPKL